MNTKHSTRTGTGVPDVIAGRLQGLRRQLWQWVAVRGLGRWLLIVLAMVVGSILIDRVFRMDFSQRLILLIVIVGVALVTLWWRVIVPMSRRPSDDALIYEIEKRHGALDEQLISSVQLDRQRGSFESSGTSRELAEATISTGLKQAESIDFDGVLDTRGFLRNLILLGGGVAAVALLGIAILSTSFFSTWFNRNVMLGDAQWPQGTHLEVAGAENGVLVVPRGAAHRQIVRVTEDSTVADVEVRLEIENGDTRSFEPMKRTGKLAGRQHALMFHNVSSEFRFRAIGGDDTTEWISVSLVQPPAIVDRAMQAVMPAYTNAEDQPLVGDGPYSILRRSGLSINATVNKPISIATLSDGERELPMEVSPDGMSFSATVPASDIQGGTYEYVLTDREDLKNSRRSKFAITIRDDAVPQVRAELLGISGLVSPRAMVPTSFQAVDEFGLTKIEFLSQWKLPDADTEQERTDLIADSTTQPADAIWKESDDVAVLDLINLKLVPGTSFRFAVAATDNQPEEPGVGRSQEFLLRVVSVAELRADLLRREEEQQKAFSQAYEDQLQLTADLSAAAISQVPPGVEPEQFEAQRDSKLIAVVRGQKMVGTSIDRVASRFEEFLVEIQNNRLEQAEIELAPDRPRIDERYDGRIIQPIRRLDRDVISLATRGIDKCRRLQNEPAAFDTAIDETLAVQQEILEEMKRILAAMNDSRNFQDFLNDLLELKSIENRIKADLQEQTQPTDIFDEPPAGIFDDE